MGLIEAAVPFALAVGLTAWSCIAGERRNRRQREAHKDAQSEALDHQKAAFQHLTAAPE